VYREGSDRPQDSCAPLAPSAWRCFRVLQRRRRPSANIDSDGPVRAFIPRPQGASPLFSCALQASRRAKQGRRMGEGDGEGSVSGWMRARHAPGNACVVCSPSFFEGLGLPSTFPSLLDRDTLSTLSRGRRYLSQSAVSHICSKYRHGQPQVPYPSRWCGRGEHAEAAGREGRRTGHRTRESPLPPPIQPPPPVVW
jgi:hypothetical protein